MAQSGPAGHPEFIEDVDRKAVGKELLILSPSSPGERTSAGGKSPRTKFVKNEGLSTAKPRVVERSPVGLVTVQEEHAVLKEWSAVGKGDKQEKFKSPALFWEIRLKESNVRAVEKVSARPSASQLVEACNVLDQYSERVLLQGDGVLASIKEQLFSALFADYNTNTNNQHKEQSFPTRKHLLQACVPYYIIAERQHSELVSNKRKVASLESQLTIPSSRSYTSSVTQTEQGELDVNSGMTAMKNKVAALKDELSRQEAERFSDKLEAEEFKNGANLQLESLRDQLNKLTIKEAHIRSSWEIEKGAAESLKEQVIRLRSENDRLKQQLQLENNEKIAMRSNDEKKINGLSETLRRERSRFRQERSDWLDSLVFERYDLLNYTEQAGRKRAEEEGEEEGRRAKASKSEQERKRKEEDEAKRALLWKGLRDAEKRAKGALEELYHEAKEVVKENRDDTHIDQVREVLREQESEMELLLVGAPQLTTWYDHRLRDQTNRRQGSFVESAKGDESPRGRRNSNVNSSGPPGDIRRQPLPGQEGNARRSSIGERRRSSATDGRRVGAGNEKEG